MWVLAFNLGNVFNWKYPEVIKLQSYKGAKGNNGKRKIK